MFNESKIRENKVCYLDGKSDALSELIHHIQTKNKKTISLLELVGMYKQAQIEYEKEWNKWADYAHIGGGRYDETGEQRKVEND